ncbi:MAG: cytochrome c [Nitrospira sp.]|nr:cytochrome c [Nitrospira sp.]
MFRCKAAILVLSAGGLVVLLGGVGIAEEPLRYGFGRPAAEGEIRALNIDIDPTGAGLPPGQGTVQQGAAVYANKCASCHGLTGTEGPKDRLVDGHDSLATAHPVKTIGSFWPYATTLYDYIHRAMPLNAPQSLTPEEVYSVVAWLLHQNGIIPADMIIDAQTLPAVKMPNRGVFVSDPRPEVTRWSIGKQGGLDSE